MSVLKNAPGVQKLGRKSIKNGLACREVRYLGSMPEGMAFLWACFFTEL